MALQTIIYHIKEDGTVETEAAEHFNGCETTIRKVVNATFGESKIIGEGCTNTPDTNKQTDVRIDSSRE